MNLNTIRVDGFSNPDSQRLYSEAWPGEPQLQEQCEAGGQCGGCSFFAPFNLDWGLCCNDASRHHLETVYEHFSCASIAHEGGWAHSFSDDERDFCRCSDYMPLPPQTELLCLRVDIEDKEGKRLRATLQANEHFTVESSSLLGALDALRTQIEDAFDS